MLKQVDGPLWAIILGMLSQRDGSAFHIPYGSTLIARTPQQLLAEKCLAVVVKVMNNNLS